MLVPDPDMPTGERVKILDFGLAKLAAVREAAMVKTNSQAVLGTPLYMSPEQCQGAGQVDVKTDVYSLGCMLYEMLSGRPPFLGAGPGEVIGKHMFKEPEPLAQLAPHVPKPLTALVERLLVKSKDERPSMRDVRQELESLASSLPPPQRREHAEGSGLLDASRMDAAVGTASTLGQGAAESTPGAAPRRRALLMAAGGLALLGLAGIALVLKSRPSSPPPTAAVTNPEPSLPKQIHHRVYTEPTGAAVISARDGKILGSTPWVREQRAASGTEPVTLRLEGYIDQTLTLDLDANTEQRVAMQPVAMQPRPPPASLPPQPKAAPLKKAGRSAIRRPSQKDAAAAGPPVEKPPSVQAVTPPPEPVSGPAAAPPPPTKKAVHERPKVEE
jgi:hypothetical protein